MRVLAIIERPNQTVTYFAFIMLRFDHNYCRTLSWFGIFWI